MGWRLALVAGLTISVLVGGALISKSNAQSTSGSDDSDVQNSAKTDDIQQKLSCCDHRATEKKSYVIVSTLDGRISAVDTSGGNVVWSMETDSEPLLASTLTNIPFYDDRREFRLIPSIDGHFYMYNDAAVQSLPFNVDSLLSGSLVFGADVLAGGKQIRTYFIDYVTGRLHQTCSASGCEIFGDQSASSIFQKLIVKRTTQTVRGVDPTTGAERWNLTVGEHELLLDERKEEPANEETCICVNDMARFLDGQKEDSPRSSATNWSSNDLGNIDLKLVPPEGLLMAYDKDDPSSMLWEKKLDSPIVQIWTLSADGQLTERTIFDQSLVPAFSYYSVSSEGQFGGGSAGRIGSQTERMIYIGTYNDQKYVVRSPEERFRLKNLRADAKDQSRVYLLAPAAHQALQLEDQSPTNEQCGNDCPTCASEEINGLILRNQYPRDMGWYLYKHQTPSHNRLLESVVSDKKKEKTKKSKQERFAKFLEELPAVYFCFLVLFVLSLVFVPTAAVAHFYGRQIKELSVLASKCLKKKDDDPKEATSEPPSPVTETTQLTPTCSQETTNPLSQLVADMTGRSYGRYTADFEPIRQLGRGGFGIVMESRNKHDDQLYAVKRIAFAPKRSAKERVRREVKALAQLEHPGIVRYFSAWFEEPPADWQKQVDREMFKRCQRPIGDEMSLESASGIQTTEIDKVNDGIESLGPTFNFAAGDFVEKESDGNPSTFGSWTDDDPKSASGHGRDFNRNDIDDDFDPKAIQLPLAPRQQQESVEIIFAHSTTAGSVLASRRSQEKNRKSSSSKHSSTKSEEDANEQHSPSSNTKSPGTAYLYIQMQLCRGTLKDWLVDNNRLEDRDRSDMLDWFDQLICAMQYVHDLGLVHRDLKPSNIFFSTTGLLKIGDFGLATTTLTSTGAVASDEQTDAGGALSIGEKTSLLASIVTNSPSRGTTDRVGTQLYMSPEQEAGRKCTSKADIYALGLIFVELLTPFKTLMERVHVLQDARRNTFSTSFAKDCAEEYDLIRQLLAQDPEMRPTCLQIRQCDLFKSCLAVRPLLYRNDQFPSGNRTISRDSGRYSSVSLNTP